MAFLVLPEYVLDRRFYHSHTLKMLKPKLEDVGGKPNFGPAVLAVQLNVMAGEQMFTHVFQGDTPQETENMFTEILAQLSVIDKQPPVPFPDQDNIEPEIPLTGTITSLTQGGPQSE
jgi:hypothetical protein